MGVESAVDRPTYETEDNRVDEREIAMSLGAAWRCDLRKLPLSYNLDYAAIRDSNLVAWVEIKRRKRTRLQFATVFLSMQKVAAAHILTAVTGKPCFFVAQFDDCLAYAKIDGNRRVEFRGRTDRSDWQDQEPVVVIPAVDFNVINKVEPKEGALT